MESCEFALSVLSEKVENEELEEQTDLDFKVYKHILTPNTSLIKSTSITFEISDPRIVN